MIKGRLFENITYKIKQLNYIYELSRCYEIYDT